MKHNVKLLLLLLEQNAVLQLETSKFSTDEFSSTYEVLVENLVVLKLWPCFEVYAKMTKYVVVLFFL